MFIERLTIIGVGLIGGSLARALRKQGVCGDIVGCGRNIENLQRGVDLGVIDRYDTDPARAVADADVVVIAVPLSGFAGVFQAIRDAVKPSVILTDVGSAKRSVVNDAKQHLSPALYPRFVPAHPIAGTEKSGVTAAFAELFEKRKVILTPHEQTDADACDYISTLWQYTGAEVVTLSVEHHDQVLAATSHLPHVLAYNLVNTLAQMDEQADVFQFAAGGFRDFTRIASSDPTMWHDICLANREAILAILARYQQHLNELSHAIKTGQSETILTAFKQAKSARDAFFG
jgi:prephenate dehydrogenase